MMGPPVIISLEEEAQNIVNDLPELERQDRRELGALREHPYRHVDGPCRRWKCVEWEGNSIWLPSGLGLHYYHLQGIPHPSQDRYQELRLP
jgi:hypothetical protein